MLTLKSSLKLVRIFKEFNNKNTKTTWSIYIYNLIDLKFNKQIKIYP